MTGTLILSSDEVRVMSRLAGAVDLLPDDDWDADDLPVADVVATRALLSRELVRFEAGTGGAPASLPDLVLAPQARALFGTPGTILSIRRDAVAGSWRATLVGTLLAREVSPEVWLLRTADEHYLDGLLDELTSEAAGSAAAGELLVPTAALTEADRLVDRSTVDDLAGFLGTYGIQQASARAVARILLHRNALTTVRLTRQSGSATLTSSLTWLEVGTATWLAAPEPAAGLDDPPEADAAGGTAYLPMPDQLPSMTRLTATDRTGLRAALGAVLADRVEAGP
jgi:hypothetical protein